MYQVAKAPTMSRRRSPGERLPPFIAVLKDTWNAPAWRAMSCGARLLYIALKARYNVKQHNNGRLFLSVRDAAKELGTSQVQVIRWYRELQHYGFIVKTTDAILSSKHGQCPHWRLTELGYRRDMPTRDYLRWDGTKFRPTPRPVRPGHGQAAQAASGFESRRVTRIRLRSNAHAA
jgi:hypothetical protein